MNPASPFRQPGFAALFASQLSAALNDNLLKNALMIWITTRQASLAGIAPSAMLGLVSALFIAPFFLFSASAGQLADRYEKTIIVRAVKVAELLIMGVAAAGFLADSLPLMLTALFLMGMHSAVLGPAKYAVLPQLVAASSLVEANALVEMGTFLAILLGTVAGGVMVGMEQGARFVAGGVLVIAVLGLAASLAMPRLSAGDKDVRVHLNPVTPMLEILRITARTRAVFLSVLGISWFWLLGVVMLSFLPAYVHDTLRAGPAVVTALFSLFCVGIALGSLLTERISGQNLELGLVPFASIGMTACLVDLFFVDASAQVAELSTLSEFYARPGAVRLSIDLFMLAMFGGLFTVPLYTLIQQRAEPSERSRTIAGNNIWNALFMVVGSLLVTFFQGSGLPARWMFLILAGLSLASAAYIYSLLPEFLLRFLAWILGRVLYRLEVRGHEHVPETGACVVVANHVAFNDWLIVAGSLRRPARFVMDHHMAKLPIVSTLLRHGKVIPIAPAHEDAALMERAFSRIAEELRAGEVVCIYPEGKITKTGEMNPFKPGIERILKETPVPVVPLAVHGLWGSFFSRKDGPAMSKLPRRFRARLTLQIGQAVPPEAASAAGLEREVKALLSQAEAS
jgi:1-acyl-sn-glycerol-3-phosphate acyltransferase